MVDDGPDSCGCSTDEVHNENITRYKKILQIANGIISEIKFKNDFNQKRILNLSDKPYTGVIEFESSLQLEGYEKIGYRKGFDEYLLALGEEKLVDLLEKKDIKMIQVFSDKFKSLLREYYYIGGMPEVISSYI